MSHYTPQCLVDFHTEKGTHSADKDVLSVTTNKTLSSPAGVFNIELVNRKDDKDKLYWYEKIRAMDVVGIQLKRDIFDTVMVGLVDEVRFSESSEGPEERVRIVGRDFGKLLLNTEILFLPQLSGEFVWTHWVKIFEQYGERLINVEPKEVIELIMREIAVNYINFPIAIEDYKVNINDVIGLNLGKLDYISRFDLTLDRFEGPIINAFKHIIPEIISELFIDTRSDLGSFGAVPWGEDKSEVLLTLRKTPFDIADWKGLITHELSENDIVHKELGRGDSENYNIFWGKPQIKTIDEGLFRTQIKPQYNEENANRYGMSELSAVAPGFRLDKDERENTIEYADAIAKKIKKWFEHNVDYWSGNIVAKGNGKYRIGQRLILPQNNKKLIFYIEGVRQNFVNFGNWHTNFTVTRGQEYAA